MGLFSNLMSKIFGQATASAPATPVATAPSQPLPTPSAPASPAAAAPVAPAAPTASGAAAPTPTTSAPVVDVAAILTALAAKSSEKLDWKKSIVDLMKLVGMDSSLSARKELADELGYTGDKSDSAAMNIWLHKQVLKKLAENGGKIPADLLD
jgi:3-oxoacyl-ACP reductase-like protein